MSDHEYFTAEATALTIPKRGAIAIYCGDAPRRDATGNATSYSMRAPMLIIPPDMFDDTDDIAATVARILNAHAEEFYPSAKKGRPTAAAGDVLAERARQISAEGWTPEHDDEHDKGEMALAAIAYLMAAVNPNAVKSWWPWEWKCFKPGPIRRMLVKAAALILAEIERLDRAAARVADHG